MASILIVTALQVIAPYIPVKNPQLPPAVYEMVLTHFLVEDHVRSISLLTVPTLLAS